MSRGNNLPDYEFQEALEFVLQNTHDDVLLEYHEKGCVWEPEKIDDSDILLLVLTTSVRTDLIGRGLWLELNQAEEADVPAYILYKRARDGAWQIYDIDRRQIFNKGADYIFYANIYFGNNVTSKVLPELYDTEDWDDLPITRNYLLMSSLS